MPLVPYFHQLPPAKIAVTVRSPILAVEKLEGVALVTGTALGPTNIFNANLTVNDAGWHGYTMRLLVFSSALAPNITGGAWMRITIKTSPTSAQVAGDTIDQTWIGTAGGGVGNPYDMSDHVQMTWAGSTSLNLAPLGLGVSVQSDWIYNPNFNSTKSLILSMHFSGTNAAAAFILTNSRVGQTYYANGFGDESALLTASVGYTNSSFQQFDWLAAIDILVGGAEMELTEDVGGQTSEVLEIQGTSTTNLAILDKAPLELLLSVGARTRAQLENLLGAAGGIGMPAESLLGAAGRVLPPDEYLLATGPRNALRAEYLATAAYVARLADELTANVGTSPWRGQLEQLLGVAGRGGDQIEQLLSARGLPGIPVEKLASLLYGAVLRDEFLLGARSGWSGPVEQVSGVMSRGGEKLEALMGARSSSGNPLEALANVFYGARLQGEFLVGAKAGWSGQAELLLGASARGGTPLEQLLGVAWRAPTWEEIVAQTNNISALSVIPLEYLLGAKRLGGEQVEDLTGVRLSGGAPAEFMTGARGGWSGIVEQLLGVVGRGGGQLEKLLGVRGIAGDPLEMLLGTSRVSGLRDEFVTGAKATGSAYIEQLLSAVSRGGAQAEQLLSVGPRTFLWDEIVSSVLVVSAISKLPLEYLTGAKALGGDQVEQLAGIKATGGGLQDEFLRAVSGGLRVPVEQLLGARGFPGIPVENLAGILGRPGLQDEIIANARALGWRGYDEILLGSSSRGGSPLEKLLAAAWVAPLWDEIIAQTFNVTGLSRLQLEVLTGVARSVGLRADQLAGVVRVGGPQVELTANVASVSRVGDEITLNLSARGLGLRDEFLITAKTSPALREEWLLGVRGAPGEVLELLSTNIVVSARSALRLEVLVNVRGFTIPQFEEIGFTVVPARIDRFHLQGRFQVVYPLGGTFTPGTQLKGKFQAVFPIGGKVKFP